MAQQCPGFCESRPIRSMLKTILKSLGVALDGLDVALCAFDDGDRTICWNQTFVKFFPEHKDHLHEGEHYQENLRRFYSVRLGAEEQAQIGAYIAEGLARHVSQQRPFEFDHRGYRYSVAAAHMGPFGRVRIWRRRAKTRRADALDAGQTDEPKHQILERIADGVLLVDDRERGQWANAAFLSLYGLSIDELRGKTFEQIYQWAWRDARAEFGLSFYETLREKQRFSGAPFVLRLPGDRWVRVLEQREDASLFPGVFVHTDITAQTRQTRALREAEERARESEGRYQLLAEAASDVTIAMRHNTVTYVSPSVRRVMGWDPSEIEGKSLFGFCHPEDAGEVLSHMQLLSGQPDTDYRARALRPDGSYVWVEARARMTPADREPNAPTLVINLRNISVRKQVEDELAVAQRRLEELAVTDPLTGIANRRRLDEALETECRRSAREGSVLSLLVLDLDDFKRINDEHGHAVGDEVLRQFGRLLACEVKRGGELAARFGGEEFVVVLPGTDSPHAKQLAERLRQGVQCMEISTVLQRGVTVSIGLATETPPGEPARLLAHADAALYEAKRTGKNKVVAFGAEPSASS